MRTLSLIFVVTGFILLIHNLSELKLITRPATTTTLTPFIYTTVKPRRKQHQGYNHKTGHNVPNRVKDILPPNNLQENEVIGGAGGSIEGKNN